MNTTSSLRGEQAKAATRGKIGRAIRAGAITQAEIAEKAGLSKATVSRYSDDVAMFLRVHTARTYEN